MKDDTTLAQKIKLFFSQNSNISFQTIAYAHIKTIGKGTIDGTSNHIDDLEEWEIGKLGYINAVRLLWLEKILTGCQAHRIMMLLRIADRNNEIHGKIPEIARRLYVSVRSVDRWFKELQDMEIIQKEKCPRCKSATLIKIVGIKDAGDNYRA